MFTVNSRTMEFGLTPSDLYAGYLEDDSDLEFSECSDVESSGDEGATVGSTACYRPSGKVHSKKDRDSGSEDEFEQEMDKELMSKIQLMVSPSVAQAAGTTRKKGRKESKVESAESAIKIDGLDISKDKSDEFYDKVYFDSSGSSDEGEMEAVSNGGPSESSARSVGKKVRKLTNDELFYDPDMDAEDEKWVNRQRMAYHNVEVSRSLEKEKKTRGMWKTSSTGGTSSQDESSTCNDTAQTSEDNLKSGVQTEAVLPRSDAVLNCPACMSTLCLDCQRHDQYVNQYRAMFVLNCLIVRDEVLNYKPKPNKKPRRKRRRGKAEEFVNESEDPGTYHPVRCRECNTEVAVYDQDEVFHFFNVLAGAPT